MPNLRTRRKVKCRAFLPVHGGDFVASCILSTRHPGMHECMYPDLLGQPICVNWHDTYPQIAATQIAPIVRDLAVRGGRA